MLVTEPRIFLIDGPFGTLDEITGEHMNVEVARDLWPLVALTVLVTRVRFTGAVFLAAASL